MRRFFSQDTAQLPTTSTQMSSTHLEKTFASTTAALWDSFYGPASDKEVDFYLNQFTDDSPLRGTTLDIGCGTGRFLLPLLQRGHQGIGIDASDDMLAVLRQKGQGAGHSPTLHLSTFEDFHSPERFNGIVAFYVVFYILQTDALRSFFKKAFSSLSSGGVFLFNTYNTFEFWRPQTWSYTNSYSFDGGFGRIEYTYKPIDHLRGIAEMQEYCTLCKNGTPHFDYNVRPVRFYTMTELSLLLSEVGFVDIKTHVELHPEPVTEQDRRGYTLYTTARRP
jgi:SAM-dependent methyltransferase